VSVDHLVGTSEQRRRHVEAEGLCRLGGLSECARTRTGASSQKQPIFRTLNSAPKMARFAGFSATLFRGVFSYTLVGTGPGHRNDSRARHARANQWQQITKLLSPQLDRAVQTAACPVDA